MNFQTPIHIDPLPHQITHLKPVLMLGSCFTENIGEKLEYYLFDATINPFGVIYNPLSVKRAILALLNKDMYEEDDLDLYNELWFSFDHYTKYSDPDKKNALAKINQDFLTAKKQLHSAGFLIITFGTAFTYRYKASGNIVCNCHKIPAKEFERFLLSPKSIIKEYSSLIPELLEVNPDLKIIFTVSPVRHLKDGLAENQRSKSTLLLAIHELAGQFPGTVQYFPSYEIMMDDLRDYRFYDEDLVHPNRQGIEYIWERFMEAVVSKEAKEIINELEPLLRDKGHHPLHTSTSAYQKFILQLTRKEENLKLKYPFLNWKSLG